MADDLPIFSLSTTKIQQMLKQLESYWNTFKIRENIAKTKVVIFSKGQSNHDWYLTLRIRKQVLQYTKGPFKKYVTAKIPNSDPPPPLVTICHRLPWPPSPPCHHPNSDKLFYLKLAEKSLGLCLNKHMRMPKSHTKWQQKSRINKKTMFYVFKTSETVVSKSEKFQITVH